jgi:hypothetical protein
MLHDRDPRFTLVSDKLSVRDFVTQAIGRDILVPLLWSGTRAEDIPFHHLPTKFIIKTNHGAGYYYVVKDSTNLNVENTKRLVNKWLRENYCKDRYIGVEWAYRNICPKVIIESLLDERGDLPIDYKFYCFLGRVEFLILHFDRSRGQKTLVLNRDFESPNFEIPTPHWPGSVSRPLNFDYMIQIAERLSENFEFIRVDLYNIQGKVYFGELTLYPGGVGVKILPPQADYFFGNRWKAL